MDSFYGGKQGISFEIKKTYKSVTDMEEDFSNPENTDVWYGEYVLINTPNKNNIDNGKIFRRTAAKGETEGSTSYSEYIGQIVGPAGGTPNIIFGSIDEIEDKFNNHTVSPPNEAIWFIDEIKGETSEKDDNSKLKTIESKSASEGVTAAGIQIKSGRDYYDSEETPALKYNWYNFRTAEANENGFAPAKLYMGLEIPYVDYDIEATSVDYTQSATVTIPQDEGNDFYYPYQLKIPRGIPGAYITNIQQATVNNNQATISGSNTSANVYELNGNVFFNGEYTRGSQKTNFNNFSKIWVGQVAYPNKLTPTLTVAPDLYYLGDVFELTGTANIVPTPGNDEFGKLTLKTTKNDINIKLPLIAKARIEPSVNNTGMNELQIGFKNASSDESITWYTVGNAFPEHWGVWAQEYNSTISTEPGSVAKPDTEEGNLIYQISEDQGRTTFYAWIPDDESDEEGNQLGHWKEIPGFGGESIFLEMPESFTLSNDKNKVTFAAEEEPSGVLPNEADISANTPWTVSS